jgi:ankyrin repeat protein
MDNNDQFTPLHQATWSGHADMARVLLEAGANVNVRDGENHTALHLAALTGHTGVAGVLLDAEADVDVTDSSSSGHPARQYRLGQAFTRSWTDRPSYS